MTKPPRKSRSLFISVGLIAVITGSILEWRLRGGKFFQSTHSPRNSDISLIKQDFIPATTPAKLSGAEEAELVESERLKIDSVFSMFKNQQFEAVVSELEKVQFDQNSSNFLKKWAIKQMGAALVSLGWQKIHSGECFDAIQILSRAERTGKIPEATKGLAVCYYKLKNIPSAGEKFHAYLNIDQNDASMKSMYADLLESDQRFAEAVTILDSIIANPQSISAPQIEQIRSRRDRMHLKAAESLNQTQIASRNFLVTFRIGVHDDLAVQAIDTVEAALDEAVTNYGLAAPTSTIEIILYPSNQFHRISGGPAWADGIYDGRMRIPVAEGNLTQQYVGRLKRVLRHELFHALVAMSSDFRTTPSWFNEGFAQFFECSATSPCSDVSSIDNSLPRKIEYKGKFLAPEVLEQPFNILDAARAGMAYDQSLFLVYYIGQTYGDGVFKQIAQQISPKGNLDSTSLLSPISVNFQRMIAGAQIAWTSNAQNTKR